MKQPWLAATLLALTSCSIHIPTLLTEQRFMTRHLPEEGALDVVIVCEGVAARSGSSASRDQLLIWLRSAARGDGVMFLGGLGAFELPLDLESAEGSVHRPEVSVRSFLVLPRQGPRELCLVQEWHVEGLDSFEEAEWYVEFEEFLELLGEPEEDGWHYGEILVEAGEYDPYVAHRLCDEGLVSEVDLPALVASLKEN